ncbi:acyltransferase [Pseudomonadales bacterium]|nr:acyltransferase [Pseudomonadales bacterium]
MRASSGLYYPRLDHIRAVAAFLVFFWHSIHQGVPFSAVPSVFFLSILEEGWVGVSLFMTLSGYLFAKIVHGKHINYGAFLWNRFVRLSPLLIVVITVYTMIHGYSWASFLKGFYTWSWPVGAWSITVELHFYILFPALLFFQHKFGKWSLVSVLVISAGLRSYLWFSNGEVQTLSYWSIIGHFDQFLLGMVFYHVSKTRLFTDRGNLIALFTAFGLLWFWHFFNQMGGFYELLGTYPSPSAFWIVLPTVEGLLLGCMIASYENTKFKLPRLIDNSLARIGEVSYSIYLWHYLLLTEFAVKIFLFPNNFAELSLLTLIYFALMVVIAIISYELIERPFLRFRIKYTNVKRS